MYEEDYAALATKCVSNEDCQAELEKVVIRPLDSVNLSDDEALNELLSYIPAHWGRELRVAETWFPIVLEAHEKIKLELPFYEIAQIKEKFGRLRYYWDISSDSKNGYDFFLRFHPRKGKGVTVAEVEARQVLRDEWDAQPENAAVIAEIRRRVDNVKKIVVAAATKANRTCEITGQHGWLTSNNRHRIRTLSPVAAKEVGAELIEQQQIIELESPAGVDEVIEKIKSFDEIPQVFYIYNQLSSQDKQIVSDYVKTLSFSGASAWGIESIVKVEFPD